ncbi:MAG: hypothetical protein US25_C0037G0006 [Candidatus Moranbacteria bacterium GW2011_GWE1_36_7]|nr:MAG: hypothetical protein UR99_C0002G0036 [Candidatus Moranbacteria bacterium GW2011_GWD2_36_12]KKQ07061.1 MAG: hypothetical protein US16_C0003G0036 [Candidatus Moranbacteria bacterium GW2011_GWE2_36_40]KKQ13611.1 MAG: hypothetical protein US25_C0037G0006 [Candidatus Moranbacteria bacterium GW2011_GWE1_36_7]
MDQGRRNPMILHRASESCCHVEIELIQTAREHAKNLDTTCFSLALTMGEIKFKR